MLVEEGFIRRWRVVQMTMLTEDYIMRMINQVLAVFLQAVGLKKAGQYSQALRAFDQAVETLLGLRAGLADQLDDRQLLTLLTFRNRLDVDRLLVLADIYAEEGEVYALQGKTGQAQFALQRSLRFYLEIALEHEANPVIELIQKIEVMRTKVIPSSLPVETRLALHDYLERLIAAEDDFLATAGLSRPGLLEAHDSLDIPEIE